MKPIITYKANAQKGRGHFNREGYFDTVLTQAVLRDICYSVTSGIKMINVQNYLPNPEILVPFSSIDEMIFEKGTLKASNRGNRSSFISKSDGEVQIYAKTYGANKYEATLFGIATAKIGEGKVTLFNICEKDLKQLPVSSRKTLGALGVAIVNTDISFEKNRMLEDDKESLRSPTYNFRLLQRLGEKKCAFCDCRISEIVQGAHIWSVSEIKQSKMSDEDKLHRAIDGNNGLWLCQNHHKLFDADIILLDKEGHVRVKKDVANDNLRFLKEITPNTAMGKEVLTDEFLYYLQKRNSTGKREQLIKKYTNYL